MRPGGCGHGASRKPGSPAPRRRRAGASLPPRSRNRRPPAAGSPARTWRSPIAAPYRPYLCFLRGASTLPPAPACLCPPNRAKRRTAPPTADARPGYVPHRPRQTHALLPRTCVASALRLRTEPAQTHAHDGCIAMPRTAGSRDRSAARGPPGASPVLPPVPQGRWRATEDPPPGSIHLGARRRTRRGCAPQACIPAQGTPQQTARLPLNRIPARQQRCRAGPETLPLAFTRSSPATATAAQARKPKSGEAGWRGPRGSTWRT